MKNARKKIAMSNSKYILITGGAGYIGSHANHELTMQGYSTLVFDNLSTGYPELAKWGKFVLGDLSNRDHLRLVFRQYPIQAVMHFAAHLVVPESVSNPEKYYFNNVVNTLNLLSTMREFQVRHIVFSSTAATYGEPQYVPIDEAHPLKPINPYGTTKLTIERILEDYHNAYQMQYAVLRYFNAAGALATGEIGEDHSPETHLIPLILDAVLGRRPNIQIFGNDYPTPDGTCIRDYIHVCDLAVAHRLALEKIFTTNTSYIFNLGSETGYSVNEVIQNAAQVTGKVIPTMLASRRPGDPAKLVSTSKKAKQILGWNPRYDLTGILQTAWQWHQKRYSAKC